MKKETKFILFVVIVIILVAAVGIIGTRAKSSASSKLDAFAQALTADGAHMYGAFWCPHCQAEKALFGASVHYLPYVECSNADRTQTPICNDNKVESYPTWKFKDGITAISKVDPVVCPVGPAKAGEPSVCVQESSAYYKTFLFPGYAFIVRSATDPVHTGDTWKFPADASTEGELPLSFLAQQIGYTLPN